MNNKLLKLVFRYTYGKKPKGWGPGIRAKYKYYTPEDYYQACLVSIINNESNWLDIGCGRDIFPGNKRLAKLLACRAKEVVGVDPSENIIENELLDKYYLGFTDKVEEENHFDVISLRMVAEHVADPDELLKQINRISKVDSHVIISTIYKWSPIPLITKITPFWAHHAPKKFFWNVEERDTFPVEYKMNTKSDLHKIFKQHGFENTYFGYIDDCRTMANFKIGLYFELTLRRILNFFGLHYAEVCILAVYKKLR